MDNRTATHTSGWPFGLEDCSSPSGQHCHRLSSAIDALDFHFANHNAAITSATLTPSWKSSLSASAHSHGQKYQALSDWHYSRAEAAEFASRIHNSMSQDPLAELGLRFALDHRCTSASLTSTEDRRRETLKCHQQAAAASHDSNWLRGCGGVSAPGSRLCSESLLAAYAEYKHNCGRSLETLAQASALISPCYEHSSPGSQKTKFSLPKDQKFSAGHQHQTTVTLSITDSSPVPPTGRQSGQQIAEPQTRCIQEEEQVGYSSYSPAGHQLQQAHFVREPSRPSFNWSPGSRGSPPGSEAGRALRLQSTPALSASEESRAQLGGDREVVSGVSVDQEVTLRLKPPSDQRTSLQTLRVSCYTTPVESGKTPSLTPKPRTPSPVRGEPSSNLRANGGLAQYAFNSLSSIPFRG